MARKYTRDNRGRFASVGATARGGRLKTAGGGKRQTQTMRAAARPGGTVGRPKGYKPGAGKPSVSGVKAIPKGELKRYRLLQNKIKPLRDSLDRNGSTMMDSTTPIKRAYQARERYSRDLRRLNRVTDTMRRLSNSPDSPNIPRLPRVTAVGPRVGRTAAIRKMDGPRKLGGQSWRDLKGQYSDGRVRYEDNYMNKLYKRKNEGETIKGPRITGVVAKPGSKPAKPPAPEGSRTRKQATSAQRRRRERILGQTRRGLWSRNPRIRAVDTGIRQLSLVGKPKTIKTYKPVSRRR